MNKIELLGRLTKDVEIIKTKNEKNMAKFSLAVKSKLDKEKTYFFDCVSFGKTGEAISKYVEKGNRIIIEGELTKEYYIDKNGNNRENISIIVNDFYFVDFKKDILSQKEDVKQESINW